MKRTVNYLEIKYERAAILIHQHKLTTCSITKNKECLKLQKSIKLK